jgi:hypothetical protein
VITTKGRREGEGSERERERQREREQERERERERERREPEGISISHSKESDGERFGEGCHSSFSEIFVSSANGRRVEDDSIIELFGRASEFGRN